jgi:hypothetical protein
MAGEKALTAEGVGRNLEDKTASSLNMSQRTIKSQHRRERSNRRWSAQVMQRSNALDLEPNLFKSTNPRRIASSLKRSAEPSKRRKGTPYQSAMSMLNFYINRAGKNLPAGQKHVLERTKRELRSVFGRAGGLTP